jgi:hypothetical protein
MVAPITHATPCGSAVATERMNPENDRDARRAVARMFGDKATRSSCRSPPPSCSRRGPRSDLPSRSGSRSPA